MNSLNRESDAARGFDARYSADVDFVLPVLALTPLSKRVLAAWEPFSFTQIVFWSLLSSRSKAASVKRGA